LIALISNSDDGNVSTCRTHSDHIISLFKYNGDKTAFCSRVDRYSRDFVKGNNRKYPSIMLHLNNGILFIDEYNDIDDLNNYILNIKLNNNLEEKTFMEWLDFDFCGTYGELKIENMYSDKICVSMTKIYDLISDDEETYFSDEDKLSIYNAECPNDELKFMLDKIGREQARQQIKNLLDSIVDQQFE
jgi:hypothetical protein